MYLEKHGKIEIMYILYGTNLFTHNDQHSTGIRLAVLNISGLMLNLLPNSHAL